MRHVVVCAVHHARHGEANGLALIDKPLMQNAGRIALEAEAAVVLGMRVAAAVDAGEAQLLRVAVPVAKYWICKRATSLVAEAMECLGGNGYVEEHGLARMYRDAPMNSLWEGTGNVNDVLRAMSLQPRAWILLAEVDCKRRRPAAGPGDDEVASSRPLPGRGDGTRLRSRRDAGYRGLAAVSAGHYWSGTPAPVSSASGHPGGGGQASVRHAPIGGEHQAIVDRAPPLERHPAVPHPPHPTRWPDR
jgi:putative acyl-CoA dehydrogenase